MNTQPTEAAMRAARGLIIYDVSTEDVARIIDRETGLPELIASCIKLLECADDVLGCFQQGVYNDHGLEELRQDVKAAQVALANTKGEPCGQSTKPKS